MSEPGQGCKVFVQRGTKMFQVFISQICVSNLKRLFQIDSPDQLWLWDEANAIRHFPNEDGSFDLSYEEAQYSRFRVEGPQLQADNGASYSAATNQQKSKSCLRTEVCTQYQSLPAVSPRNGKRLKIGDFQVESDTSQLNRSDVVSSVELILRHFEELRSDVGVLRSDMGILRSDVSILLRDMNVLQRDVSILRRDMRIVLSGSTTPGSQA